MEEFELFKLLKDKGYTLSSAESLTGGEFGYIITSHPGASNYFKGSLVTYVNETKEKLGVKKETLDEYGAVSTSCAKEMCEKANEFFKTDVAISFTGNAGPSASEGKPVGLVYIGISIRNKTEVFEFHFKGNREEIRNQCIEEGINKLINALKI